MALKLATKWLVLLCLVITGAYVILNLLAPTKTQSGMTFDDLMNQEQDSFPAVFRMVDYPVEYYQKSPPNCFVQGTMSFFKAGGSSTQAATCACFLGWHGPTCDIPTGLLSPLGSLNQSVVRLPQRQRRLIYVLLLNETLKSALKRIRYLQDVVDVFVYGNLSSANASQFLRFYERSQWEFGHQMLFVWKFSGSDRPDTLHRDLVATAFRRLSEIRLDDLVALPRRGETPDRDLLLYLKLHEGFPEQIFLNYHKLKQKPGVVQPDVCTVAFLLRCCQFDLFQLKGHGKAPDATSPKWILDQ